MSNVNNRVVEGDIQLLALYCPYVLYSEGQKRAV